MVYGFWLGFKNKVHCNGNHHQQPFYIPLLDVGLSSERKFWPTNISNGNNV